MAVEREATIERAIANVGRVRWIVVLLLFAATVINYVDRQMIGLLKPTLQSEFKWDETTYANIVFYFQLAYAVGYLVFGNFPDPWTWAGAGLIIVSGVYIAIRERRRRRD